MNKEPRTSGDTAKNSRCLLDKIPLSINMVIVGGGRACKFFLDLIKNDPFPFLDLKILGVYDVRKQAEGLVLAQEMGIFTTDKLNSLLAVKGLDSILELTGKKKILQDVIRLKPKGVGVLEYNISRILKNLFDMSQCLKSAQKELITEKTFSDFMIQQSTAAIVILDTNFKIVDANDTYLRTVHKSKEQVVGAHCYEISHGINVPCSSAFQGVKCPMIETLRTGKNVHVIHDHPSPEGAPMYCDLTTYPVKNEAGAITQVIEFWRDITDEFSHRWDKRVREYQSDIQNLVQEDRMISLGKLAASCAHEINNPIQGLLTFSEYMLAILEENNPGPDNLEQFKSHLTLMSKELERCGNIVSGLLSFSRESTVEYKPIDINEVIDSVLSLTRHKMELGNIKLTVRLHPAPLMLEGDINQLQQCVLNLIFNAIESMAKKGHLTVISESDETGEYARVKIRDTGSGIPEESRDKLFDPFFSTKEVGEGTGLGLSIVYGMVKNHRGTIKVDSQLGKGTEFILAFPTC